MLLCFASVLQNVRGRRRWRARGQGRLTLRCPKQWPLGWYEMCCEYYFCARVCGGVPSLLFPFRGCSCTCRESSACLSCSRYHHHHHERLSRLSFALDAAVCHGGAQPIADADRADWVGARRQAGSSGRRTPRIFLFLFQQCHAATTIEFHSNNNHIRHCHQPSSIDTAFLWWFWVEQRRRCESTRNINFFRQARRRRGRRRG